MAVTLVTVAGHVVDPDGTSLASGTVTAYLSQAGATPSGAESVRIAGESSSAIGALGAVSFGLVPNALITPSGTYYVMTFAGLLPSGTATRWVEHWQLAASPSTIDVGSVPRIDIGET